MKSYADSIRHKREFENEKDMANLKGETKEEARIILTSHGGKQAAKHALAELYAASVKWPQGWLPTARIPAPLRVLKSLELTGVIESEQEASFPMTEGTYALNQGRSHVIKYRLTALGKQIAQGVKDARVS